jgi:hypothetical protein
MANNSMFEVFCCDPIQYVYVEREEEHSDSVVFGDSETYEEREARREKDEVLGWTLDASARGVTVMGVAVFVSTALLKLAKGLQAARQHHRIMTMPTWYRTVKKKSLE